MSGGELAIESRRSGTRPRGCRRSRRAAASTRPCRRYAIRSEPRPSTGCRAASRASARSSAFPRRADPRPRGRHACQALHRAVRANACGTRPTRSRASAGRPGRTRAASWRQSARAVQRHVAHGHRDARPVRRAGVAREREGCDGGRASWRRRPLSQGAWRTASASRVQALPLIESLRVEERLFAGTFAPRSGFWRLPRRPRGDTARAGDPLRRGRSIPVTQGCVCHQLTRSGEATATTPR